MGSTRVLQLSHFPGRSRRLGGGDGDVVFLFSSSLNFSASSSYEFVWMLTASRPYLPPGSCQRGGGSCQGSCPAEVFSGPCPRGGGWGGGYASPVGVRPPYRPLCRRCLHCISCCNSHRQVLPQRSVLPQQKKHKHRPCSKKLTNPRTSALSALRLCTKSPCRRVFTEHGGFLARPQSQEGSSPRALTKSRNTHTR